jgi:hypothetical protein
MADKKPSVAKTPGKAVKQNPVAARNKFKEKYGWVPAKLVTGGMAKRKANKEAAKKK